MYDETAFKRHYLLFPSLYNRFIKKNVTQVAVEGELIY